MRAHRVWILSALLVATSAQVFGASIPPGPAPFIDQTIRLRARGTAGIARFDTGGLIGAGPNTGLIVLETIDFTVPKVTCPAAGTPVQMRMATKPFLEFRKLSEDQLFVRAPARFSYCIKTGTTAVNSPPGIGTFTVTRNANGTTSVDAAWRPLREDELSTEGITAAELATILQDLAKFSPTQQLHQTFPSDQIELIGFRVCESVGVDLVDGDVPVPPGSLAVIRSAGSMPPLRATAHANVIDPAAVNVVWRLTVTHAPRGTRDDRLLETNLLLYQPWKLGVDIASDFFGGVAMLEATVGSCPTVTVPFAILGENPDASDAAATSVDSVARTYIRAVGEPFAEAIALLESQFRQFTRPSPGPAFSGPGDRWGLFMLPNATTAQTWSWRANAQAAAAIMREQRRNVTLYFEAVQRTFPDRYESPPDHVPAGTSTRLSAVDASAIQAYRMSSVVRLLTDRSGGKTSFPSAYAFDENALPGMRWRYVSNGMNGAPDYVQLVIQKYETLPR